LGGKLKPRGYSLIEKGNRGEATGPTGTGVRKGLCKRKAGSKQKNRKFSERTACVYKKLQTVWGDLPLERRQRGESRTPTNGTGEHSRGT